MKRKVEDKRKERKQTGKGNQETYNPFLVNKREV